MMKSNEQNMKDLVYGYMRESEKLCTNYMCIIPEDVKAICLLYHGKPIHVELTHEMEEKLAESWGLSVEFILSSVYSTLPLRFFYSNLPQLKMMETYHTIRGI